MPNTEQQFYCHVCYGEFAHARQFLEHPCRGKLENRMTHQQMVQAFQEKFGIPIGRKPGDNFADPAIRRLRAALVFEEACEFVEACGFKPSDLMKETNLTEWPEPNFIEACDAMADIEYVVLGSAVTWGVDSGKVFVEVHKTNLTKEGGARRQDGKICKPAGWKPPDIEGCLKEQGWSPYP